MRVYRDKVTGERVVEIDDLSFLYDRDNFNWFSRHWKTFRCSRALKSADRIIAIDNKVRTEINRYYFIPKERIQVRIPQSPTSQC